MDAKFSGRTDRDFRVRKDDSSRYHSQSEREYNDRRRSRQTDLNDYFFQELKNNKTELATILTAINDIQIKIEAAMKNGESTDGFYKDKQELINRELKLRDENIALIGKLDNTTSTSHDVSYSIHEFQFPNIQSRYFPFNGIGSVLFSRKVLVKNIVDHTTGTGENSYYRGPRGCGKSVLLCLVGRELQLRGENVFHILHANKLSKMTEDFLINFEKAVDVEEGKKIYLLIDEVQNNTNDELWNYLLKISEKIVVIGFGVPSLIVQSPDFLNKFPPSRILLTNDDIDSEFVALFQNLRLTSQSSSSSSHSSSTIIITDDIVKEVLVTLLAYTGGHMFPFLKLSEHIFLHHSDKIVNGTYPSVYLSSSFPDSEVYQSILKRCFDVPASVTSATVRILDMCSLSEEDVINLDKLGYWSKERSWFLSDYFLAVIMKDSIRKEMLPLIWEAADPIVEMISKALKTISMSHFLEPDRTRLSYENAIGFHIGRKLYGIQGLHVSTQTLQVRYPDGRGSNPIIDIYVNGRMDLFIELIRNGNNIKAHFDRFESQDGAYIAHRNNYILLDFELLKYIPSKLSRDYEQYSNKYYCFVVTTNCLYRGEQLVSKNVSDKLKSSGGKDLIPSLLI